MCREFAGLAAAASPKLGRPRHGWGSARRDMFPPMATGEQAAALKSNPVFAALPAREIEALAGTAREDAYRAREYVFMEGDPARWLCLVISGRVKIVRHSRTGKDVVLELLGPGEIFGGVAVIEKRPYPAAAQAVEPTTVLKIPADVLTAASERHPDIIKEMALMIGRRLREAHDSVKSLSVDPVEARLAATLLRLAERDGARTKAGLALPFHLTRQSLADMTGTTVETAIRVVSRWLKARLVIDEGGRLVIADKTALAEIAAGEPKD
jgi:CRP/FNR family transcriptional regulator, nitrogen oxide reductase regulator